MKAPAPTARRSDPLTSHLAAARAALSAGTDRQRCYDALRAHPAGLTDFELAALVNRQQTSAGKRRGELVAAGLVEMVPGETRRSPSGSSAKVWRIVRA